MSKGDIRSHWQGRDSQAKIPVFPCWKEIVWSQPFLDPQQEQIYEAKPPLRGEVKTTFHSRSFLRQHQAKRFHNLLAVFKIMSGIVGKTAYTDTKYKLILEENFMDLQELYLLKQHIAHQLLWKLYLKFKNRRFVSLNIRNDNLKRKWIVSTVPYMHTDQK